MIMRMATVAALSVVLAGAAVAQSSVPPAVTDTAPAASTAEPAAPAARDAGTPNSGTTTASATEAPASLDECIASAATLGQMAEAKTLTDSNLEKLDELFTKMETLCDAKQFSEAAAVGSDIKTVIDGQ